MIEEVFIKLSIVLILAVGVTAIMRILKQPLIIGYIITGIIVGPYFLDLIAENETVGTFAKLGIALLLFMVGLRLNPKVIKEVGIVSLITGVGQVIFTSVIGFVIAIALGFNTITSFYIAMALTFSSTIIIMKLLSDKGDLNTLYGKIAVGFLIIQDLIAIFVLMAISSFSSSSDVSSLFFETFLMGIVAIVLLFLFSFFVLPFVIKLVARSQEFLFLFSLSWALALASLFQYLNFSIEIGALLAGVALSMSPYENEISAKMKPLRDFFIVMFFIVLGSQMILGDVGQQIVPIALFSLFILIGNPLIVMVLMGFLGYKKRTSFLAGLTVAQISEFSFILIALGITVGHISKDTLSLITVVGLITIAGSTYMINYSNKIYPFLSKYLDVFERKKTRNQKVTDKEYNTILFGYNRIGFGILRSLKKLKRGYLVVDFNPDVISTLSKFRIPNVYGDAYDSDFLGELPLGKAKLIISTIPDSETNLLLVEAVKKINSKAIIIVRANQVEDAFTLYKKGADYVLTPHFIGGDYISKMIEEFKSDPKDYKKEKDKHIKTLKEIIERQKGKRHKID